ncbi:phage major capsid protein [Lacticaseibacillus pabuli]|uniref:Phage major capsid protein n=1 Tax=Lacticaseibacillus pabuli TaxID=3025672 RepID=A0ABY7WPE1_9LACO|nr:phage major capsid protein [Lacticaseibacillus sp. KACC 23028]WDF82067.1 phage major capsid protein [Lacticaseibacillus sp. KACC 23028]
MNNNDDTEKRLNPDAALNVDDSANSQATDDTDKDASDTNSDGSKHLTGYAVVFNRPSKNLGSFVEVIDPHAFDNVDLSDVYLTNNHDMSQVLASTKAGTLTLTVDDKGLAFDATLPDTTLADDTAANVDAGNISNMSFTFVNAQDGDTFTRGDDGTVTRTIKSIKSLLDVTLVAIPAYDDTNVQVSQRSLDKARAEATKVETPEDNQNTHTEKRGFNKMENTIIDANKPETSAYEAYIRSHGEQRDGLNSTTAGAMVPSEVINEVWNLKQSTDDLAKFATVKQVGTPVGTYPIATVNGAVLATKDELADIADIDADLYKGVDYKVATRAGRIYLSDELIEDSAVDIVATVKDQLKQLVTNTNNAEIVKVLQGFKAAAAASLDDVKQVVNVQLDPALTVSFVINQDTYQYLDSMKDSEGRYLLQPDITSPSGKSLFGRQVVVVSNKLMPSPKDSYPMFAGDIAQSVFVAQKNEVETQWDKFDQYASGLAVVLRNDYEVVDPDAGRFITIKPAAATPAATGNGAA